MTYVVTGKDYVDAVVYTIVALNVRDAISQAKKNARRDEIFSRMNRPVRWIAEKQFLNN